MQVTPAFHYLVALAFICCNLSHNIHVSTAPAAEGDIAGISSATSNVPMDQEKPMFSLLRADKLDLPAAADSNVALAEVEGPSAAATAALHEESGSRQTRQVIIPYGSYPSYYGGYPYIYPYSYSYRPYHYYRPHYTYGYPFYFYG